jgi:chemotaxis protein MotC
VLRQIARGGAFAASELSLARGALAFAEGRAAQAREMLLPIDARHTDPSLGGQLALVQAALVLAEDREKSIELLGIARLLAPGTLVEETALRRQISLVGETADAERFAILARQYARRFKQSLYAEEFRTTFANSLVKIGANPNVDHANSLEPVLATFDRDERCRLAIIIARTTLLQGAMQSAVSFSELVMRPPVDPGCDVVRARLYRAAAKAGDPNADADLMALEKLDPSRLSRADSVLHQAALKMARMVRTWPEAQAPEVAPDPSRDKSAALLADAERLMVATNELLVRKRR